MSSAARAYAASKPADSITETLGSAGGGTRSLDLPKALERGDNLGRYIVLDQLGSGGMGVVFSAYDPELDRRLAVKLLRADLAAGGDLELQARLRREAQAMARLQHPNVITVHDVGWFEGRVFVAMEHVRGTTLKQWLERQPRAAGEILRVFQAAGRGLAAAHAAGLVHRDFKAGNVMVGEDGRVIVLDFGLACPATGVSGRGTAPPGRPAGPPLELAGTPAYMAPEQRAGEAADARSDQFSFCVALCQALTGEHPFPAAVAHLREDAAVDWTSPRIALAERELAWLRPVLRRGLLARPAGRFEHMDELLAALAADPRRRSRRRWTAASVLVALLAGGALAAAALLRGAERQERLCQPAPEALAELEDPGRRRRVAAAFEASGREYAARAFEGAAHSLDGYLRNWSAMYRDACLATHVRGEQSLGLLDLRMDCLRRRRQEAEVLLAELERGEPRVVDQAIELAAGLTPLDGCADTVALMTPSRPPADPATRERVEALRRLLTTAKVLQESGQANEARGLVEPLLAEARSLAYWPAVAETLYRWARLEEGRRPDEAAQVYARALMAAEAGRHDRAAVEIFTRLAHVAGVRRQRFEEGLTYAAQGESLLAHLGQRAGHQAELAEKVGSIHLRQGLHDQALEKYHHALALKQEIVGARHPSIARTLIRLGNVLGELGRLSQARLHFEQAIEIFTASYGPRHPEVATALGGLGFLELKVGRLEDARRHLERSLEIREQVLGPGHPDLASSLNSIGNQLVIAGDGAAAAELFARALGILEASEGAADAKVAVVLIGQANAWTQMQRFEQAEAAFRRALDIQVAALGEQHPRVGTTWFNLGTLHQKQRRSGLALDAYRRALGIWERAHGPHHAHVATGLTAIAEVELLEGRGRRALPLLQRAWAIRQDAEGNAWDDGVTLFRLAQALAATGDRDAADRRAAQARAAFEGAPESLAPVRLELERWLAEHLPTAG